AKVAQQRAGIEAVKHRLAAARHVLIRKKDLARADQLNAHEVDAADALVRELEAVERAETAKLSELQLNDPSISVNRARADASARQARLDQARRGEEECLLR